MLREVCGAGGEFANRWDCTGGDTVLAALTVTGTVLVLLGYVMVAQTMRHATRVLPPETPVRRAFRDLQVIFLWCAASGYGVMGLGAYGLPSGDWMRALYYGGAGALWVLAFFTWRFVLVHAPSLRGMVEDVATRERLRELRKAQDLEGMVRYVESRMVEMRAGGGRGDR